MIRVINRLIFVLAIAGLLVSGYLLEKYLFGGPILCGVSQGCDTVRASSYAYPLGIPMPLYGILFYFAILIGSFLLTLQTAKKYAQAINCLLFGISLAGFGFSAYLYYLEVAVIGAICFWCTVSGIISTVLTILTGANLWINRRQIS